uniref:Guanylate cyclase domain-containing protein n=1 Tax=Meloidogyne javanica TaxID=6303 RepID=A0A915N4K7_MELJA
MAKRSSSTCSAESGEYTVVADLNSKEELKGSISFAKGRGAATRWMKKFEQEKDGVYSVRLRCAFKRKTKCPLKLKGSSDGTAHLLSISAGQHLGHKLAELPGIEQVFHLPNAQIVSGVENGPKVVLENDNNEMMTVNRGDLGNVGTSDTACKKTPFAEGVTLNGMFRAFDEAISRHQAFKVETIGDAYMVASGVPQQMDSHIKEIASVALLQRDFLCHYEIPHRPSQYLHCRWGFNSGSVFTDKSRIYCTTNQNFSIPDFRPLDFSISIPGVVGITAPRYCVFGTTVTLAAKMENSGQPDKIQMTLRSYQLLSEQFPEFKCAPRGGVRIEGVGTLLTYWLEGLDNELLETARTDSGLQHVPIIPRAGTPPTPPPII